MRGGESLTYKQKAAILLISLGPETFDRYKIIGFVGRVDYGIHAGASHYTRGWRRALALFVNYAGVGYKTTMGMGRMRMTPSR